MTSQKIQYPGVLQPEEYETKLFPHQLTSIHEMEEMEEKKLIDIDGLYSISTNLGIQADITGYGKTPSMIGLVIRDKMNWCCSVNFQKEEIYTANSEIRVSRKTIHPRLPTTLILVSQSLVSQWKKELSKTDLAFDVVRTRKKANKIQVEDFQAVICTPTMYNQLISRFHDMAWKRVIYDEPGTTQIRGMKAIIAGFIWFVTATPSMIKWKYANRRSHFISRLGLSFLEPLFFNSLQIKKRRRLCEKFLENASCSPFDLSVLPADL